MFLVASVYLALPSSQADVLTMGVVVVVIPVMMSSSSMKAAESSFCSNFSTRIWTLSGQVA